MLAISLAVVPVTGIWYTTARQPYLRAEEASVPVAGARELPLTPQQQADYHLLSAAVALDAAGRVSGYVLITARGGYKSVITVQSTFSSNGQQLAGIRVLSQNETAYLGARVSGEAFAAAFAGRRLPLKLWHSARIGSPVDGLSGSTISAQAVVDAVNDAHGFLQLYLAS